MPLFRDHPVRSAVAVASALLVAYLVSSLHAFHLTQTSVAILAIAALMFFITMHHREGGQLLTQTQEEMALIGGFALFCLAGLVAWRALGADQHSLGRQGEPGLTRGLRPYPCSSDDVYCVVEEYAFW